MPKSTFFNLLSEKRRRIADLAIEEFAQFPYGQASISRLVDRAGIAKGSFYQYFENKADLYQWVLFEVIAERKLQYFKSFTPDPGADFFTQLETMLMAGLQWGLENPRLSRVASWVFHSASDPDIAGLHGAYRRRVSVVTRAYLRRAQEAGHLRADLDLDIASDVVSAVLQQGLDSALQRLVGVDLLEFCSHPELAERLPESERRKMIHGLVDVLRNGLAPAGGVPSTSITLDFNELGEEILGEMRNT